MRGLWRFYTGYLKVRLTGYSPERFFNLCRSAGLTLWNLQKEADGYVFFLLLSDFYQIRPFVRKAGVKVRIQQKIGLPFFLYQHRKRKLFVTGLTAFFLLLFCLSRFIWNISFSGNLHFTDDVLLHQLKEIGVCYGMRKTGVDCDVIEETLRSRCPEIVWVSAHVEGTQLQIRVRENATATQIPIADDTPRNLVSEKDGTVLSVLVRKGKAAVAVGDEVKAGQLLVSGELPIFDDSGEAVRSLYVRADADIVLQTTQTYQEQIPRFHTMRSYTGKCQRGVRLRVGQADFLALLPLGGEHSWEIVADSRQWVLFGDFFLPVWTERITAREYENFERKWTTKELDALTTAIHTRKIQNLMQKGVQIMENDVKILDNSTGRVVRGSITAKEPVGTGQNLDQSEGVIGQNECN